VAAQQIGDTFEARPSSTMEEVVTKEPAAVLQVRVPCLGSSSAGRDAGGGWADGFAKEPKEKGEADSVVSISKQPLAVRTR
jgi:hypothetical protein